MKKTLKISGIIGILVILALCCFGCSKEVEMVRPATAEEAINLFNQYRKEKESLIKEYEAKYGPITINSDSLDSYPWGWIDMPWPWDN